MIPLYDPKQDRIIASGGIAGEQYESPSLLLLNILIEIRAMNAIFLESQRGTVLQSIEQYRSDAINDVTAATTLTL